ncbi:BglG family transcription antiterminator [Abyssisolibacter fermentans]|uniref:BglG family transcription antiterminator n=1 Tax=Abyssisolibacter fermentans TaxID=1766203 RepID=UPI0008337A13|nr:BglG family transcription antiterminator [Abyssisolibacter fermentans]
MKKLSNERCGEILKILMENQKPITINDIADKLKVSNRTIRNDLQKIEDSIKNNDEIKIIKKPRIGIWIQTTLKGKKFLQAVISDNNEYIQPYSSKLRKRYIIKRLLLSDDSVTMQNLGNELYVSRITIYNDFEEVENWLSKYSLKIKRKKNYGVEVVGKEQDLRKAVADLLTILRKEEKRESDFYDFKPNEFRRIHKQAQIQLEDLFKNIDLNKIELILTHVEQNMDFKLTDESYSCLVIHVAIALERLKKNKVVQMLEGQLNELKKKNEYRVAKKISSQIKARFDIDFPEAEIGNLALHILCSKIQQNIKNNSSEELLINIDTDIIEIAKEIILLIENILSVDFSKDNKLFIGLVLHLRAAINRMKYGLSIRNPLLKDIKKNYPSIFGAAWASSVLFEKYFGIKVTEEEIGYIAIHIGAALERLNEKTRAVIVCSSGIGTAQLVAVRLEREIRGLEIVDITSVHDIKNIKTNDFDLIISTLPFEYLSKPVIQINPIINKDDLEAVKKYLKNIENTRRFIKGNLSDKKNDLFQKELILPKVKATNKIQLINDLCGILINKGYVENGFLNIALERERITSTAVGKGVAIPHGSHDFVSKPTILVATLEEPIEWSNGKVDIVFLLALKFENKNEIRYFFKNFYSMLDNEEILNLIRDKRTSEEIYEVLLDNKIF